MSTSAAIAEPLLRQAFGRRARRLIPRHTSSSTPWSLAPPRIDLGTRLCDFATNRRGKRGRHRETMEPLTCRGLLARVEREQGIDPWHWYFQVVAKNN